MSERKISIIGRQDITGQLGALKRIQDWMYGPDEIEVSTLKERVYEFLKDMQEIVDEAPKSRGGFKLEEIEIRADISAKGKVSLLGTGGELGGSGGITFKLKRSQ